jgi:hypothetical protein
MTRNKKAFITKHKELYDTNKTKNLSKQQTLHIMKYVLMYLVMGVLDVHFLLGISTYLQAVLATKTHLAEESAVAHW